MTKTESRVIIVHVDAMGYRQMVRQRTLTPSFQGSNPCSPAGIETRNIEFTMVFRLFFCSWMQGASRHRGHKCGIFPQCPKITKNPGCLLHFNWPVWAGSRAFLSRAQRAGKENIFQRRWNVRWHSKNIGKNRESAHECMGNKRSYCAK